MMGTEVNQTLFAWSQGGSTERDGSQGVSASQTLDRGSISFGRFELESLSWEKWSAFTNDRRNEEFGKFNGLVARKKAYFEEYYKKIRELKASQQQNQQTELTLEYSGDGSDSSLTAEDEQAANRETPTGSGTVLYDYMEGAAQETTSEHGLQCCDDQQNETFNTDFSSSNVSLSTGALQQTDKDTKETISVDNSKMDVEKHNAFSGHDDTRRAYEAARTPRRLVEKNSMCRHTPKTIPRSVQSLSKRAVNYTFAHERPGSTKHSTSMNQKTKPGNVHPFQRPNASTQKTTDPAEKNKATGLRRPSSAVARRPFTGEWKPIARETSNRPADVSTLRHPSTAERRPVTCEHAQQQAIVSTPRQSSTSERRPVKRENASKPADVSPKRLPLTGERRTITRESILITDVKTPNKPRAATAHSKSDTSTVGDEKMAITPNAARSSRLETKSNTNRLKGPSALDISSTRSKRMDSPVSGQQKSSSVNLPPRKSSSSNVGEPAVVARPKKKEGIQATARSRASTLRKTTPLLTGNVKARAPNAQPPPSCRSLRMTSKPNASNSSLISGRKPKYGTHHEHGNRGPFSYMVLHSY